MEEADGLTSDGDLDGDLQEEDSHTSSTQRQRQRQHKVILDSDEEGIADLFAEDKGSGKSCQYRLVFPF